MKPTLQFRLSQHLTLTPQLQQSIKLLQLSTVELNQEIERILIENPLLEREEFGEPGATAVSFSSPEEAAAPVEAPPEPMPDSGGDTPLQDSPANPNDDWQPDFSGSSRNNGSEDDEENDRGYVAAEQPSLRDHLNAQLAFTKLDQRDRALVTLLIDALDDDGYLTQSLEEIAEMLPEEAEIEPEELGAALHHLQHMEPTGVGARTPSECLLLQIRARYDATEPTTLVATEIVKHHLEALAQRDYNRLREATGADDEALRAAQQMIQSLNPRPGAAFAQVEARYVIPDVVVRKVKGAWRASLNGDAMPKLRVNRMYADLLAGQRGGGGLSGQLQEARWLIKNVQQRFDTILRVSQAIVERQRGFFDHGEVAMRPMVLREIAETLNLHESTISRVTTQKYMVTPRGTFELKYFFGSHVATDTGGAASATAIRALIKQLIGAENTRAPLSDSRISQILGQQGIVVARRTIAKYREALNIPPVNLRKAL